MDRGAARSLARWVRPRAGAAALAVLILAAGPARSAEPAASRPTDLPRGDPAALADHRTGLRTGEVRPDGRAETTTGPAAGPRQPVSTFGFDAILNRPPFAVPADPTGALGTTWFLAAVNVHVAVYDRSGTPAPAFDPPVRLLGLASFPRGTIDFDPKVVYDHYAQHFVLLFLAVNDRRERGWIVVATAPDEGVDDPGAWCVRKFPGDPVPGDGRQWPDYPGLGFDADRVTITSNQFTFRPARFRYAQILSIPKDTLYDCDRVATATVFHGRQTRDPDGSKAFTIQPAVSYGPAGRQHLVSFDDQGLRGNRLTVWRILEGRDGLRLTRASVRVGPATVAPLGTQGGGTVSDPDTFWDTGDLRLVTAAYDGDLRALYTAHTVEADLAPGDRYIESAVRWYEVRPARRLGRSSLLRKGLIGASRADAGWPAVVTDGAGNLIVAYSQASARRDEFLSAYAAVVAPGERSATTALLRPGEARHEAKPGYERWGDFNAASRDPLDPSVVVLVNQFAKGDGGDPVTDDWQQRIDLVRA
ncbi:MAG TPA: hypothetical protein VNO17_05505 [Actinomycetota bacterium]|nr:hypothetical protein [Actinomycetota bacterium]